MEVQRHIRSRIFYLITNLAEKIMNRREFVERARSEFHE